MSEFVEDTYMLLREHASKALAAKLTRLAGEFPRGPAGKTIVINSMKANGFSDEEIAEANDVLAAAGIR